MPIQDLYDGDNSTTDFTITFEYTSRDFIEVYVDDVLQTATTHYSFLSDTSIRFVTAPASGTDNVKFLRNTSTTLLVDFAAGASILDTDLDTANNQLLHVAEERASEAYVNAQISSAVLDPTHTVSAFGQTLIDDISASAARSTLGAGVFGESLFTASGSGVVMGLLGGTAVGQQVFTASSAAAARGFISVPTDVPQDNLVVNSDFQVCQTGTTFTTPNDNTYTADQWVILQEANGTVSLSVAATEQTPSGGKSRVAVEQVIGNNDWGLFQVLESQKSIPLRSRDVYLSFAGTATGDLTDMRFGIVSWAGTADAPTTDCVGTWGGTAVPVEATSWTYVEPDTAADAEITLDGTWTTYGAKFTVPAGCNNLGVFILTRDTASTAGADVFLSEVQLCISDVQTPYQSPRLVDEIRECERFLAKTFDLETAPAQNIGSNDGALSSHTYAEGGGTYVAQADWRFPTRMVKVPTVTTYNPRAADTGWRNADNDVTRALGVTSESRQGCSITSAKTSADLDEFFIHASADARF